MPKDLGESQKADTSSLAGSYLVCLFISLAMAGGPLFGNDLKFKEKIGAV